MNERAEQLTEWLQHKADAERLGSARPEQIADVLTFGFTPEFMSSIPDGALKSEWARRSAAKRKSRSGGKIWGSHNPATPRCRCARCIRARSSPEVAQCYVSTDDQHTGKCAGARAIRGGKWERCNRPVKFHVHYGTGCAQMCGIHARQMSLKRRGSEVTRLTVHTSPEVAQ
jgi:hypothetical protein